MEKEFHLYNQTEEYVLLPYLVKLENNYFGGNTEGFAKNEDRDDINKNEDGLYIDITGIGDIDKNVNFPD